MRGLKTNHTASVVIRGHAFVQNLRRGHYELGTGAGSGRYVKATVRLGIVHRGVGGDFG